MSETLAFMFDPKNLEGITYLLIVVLIFMGCMLLIGAAAWVIDWYIGYRNIKRGKYLAHLKGSDWK